MREHAARVAAFLRLAHDRARECSPARAVVERKDVVQALRTSTDALPYFPEPQALPQQSHRKGRRRAPYTRSGVRGPHPGIQVPHTMRRALRSGEGTAAERYGLISHVPKEPSHHSGVFRTVASLAPVVLRKVLRPLGLFTMRRPELSSHARSSSPYTAGVRLRLRSQSTYAPFPASEHRARDALSFASPSSSFRSDDGQHAARSPEQKFKQPRRFRRGCFPSGRIGRADWIRTSDHLHPMQVRYQAALQPAMP